MSGINNSVLTDNDEYVAMSRQLCLAYDRSLRSGKVMDGLFGKSAVLLAHLEAVFPGASYQENHTRAHRFIVSAITDVPKRQREAYVSGLLELVVNDADAVVSIASMPAFKPLQGVSIYDLSRREVELITGCDVGKRFIPKDYYEDVVARYDA